MYKTTKQVVIDGQTYPEGHVLPADKVSGRMIELGLVTVVKEEQSKVEEVLLEDTVEELEENEQLLIDDSSDVEVDED